MKLGLVSAALKQLPAEAVVAYAAENGMDAIEWSNCHLAAGDIAKAEALSKACKAANLSVAAYGAAYCIAADETSNEKFTDVLHTAQALGTDNVRIAAGNIPSDKADEAFLQFFFNRTAELSELAAQSGITLSFVFCSNTLFDNYNSARALLERVGKSNLCIDWRPNQTTSMIYNIYELKMLLRYIKNVHVFYRSTLGENLPLVEGMDGWRQYIKILRSDDSRALLLESAPHDSPEEMRRDFALLKQLAQ